MCSSEIKDQHECYNWLFKDNWAREGQIIGGNGRSKKTRSFERGKDRWYWERTWPITRALIGRTLSPFRTLSRYLWPPRVSASLNWTRFLACSDRREIVQSEESNCSNWSNRLEKRESARIKEMYRKIEGEPRNVQIDETVQSTIRRKLINSKSKELLVILVMINWI